MNRIQNAINKTAESINRRITLGQTTTDKVAEIGKGLAMSMDEYALLQELKSLAVQEGRLTVEEGMLVYGLLGNSISVYEGQPTHVKVVLTSLYAELLARRVAS